MPYRFAVDARSYEDLASGRVIRSAPKQAAFPVRLAREMFEQACALTPTQTRHVLYDPCCGAGHLLTSLGLLYPSRLSAVIGSDVDEDAVALARQNLRLLRRDGLAERIAELTSMSERYRKPAHEQALASARSLAANLGELEVHGFKADAGDERQVRHGLGPHAPDIVVVDVPYGRLSSWSSKDHPIERMLDALEPVLAPGAVIAVATSKDLKVSHPRLERARQMPVGYRRLTWLVARA